MTHSLSAVAALATTLALCFSSSSAFAQTPPTGGATHPCVQIEQQCKAAGFVQGQVKEGTGLWVDCIDPIMRGTPQPAKAKMKIPSVDPALVSACKAKNPNFGEGKKK